MHENATPDLATTTTTALDRAAAAAADGPPALRFPFDATALTETPISTERLVLRPLEASDAPDVFEYQRIPEVLRYLPWPERDRAEAYEHTAKRAAARVLEGDGDFFVLAMTLPGVPSVEVTTGVASTGVASTGVASTGVASTGVASTGVASTGVASTGVASTGVASTGVASTGVASTGVASTGVASTGVASTGVASTGVASTGVASTGVASTGVASTGVASTGVASTGVASTVESSSVESTRDRVIGDMMVRVSSAKHAQLELGWVVHPDFQGKGYAREAAVAIRDFAFETLNPHRIQAFLDARNEASAGLCQRLGMRREATILEEQYNDGEWQDTALYGVLRREWAGARG